MPKNSQLLLDIGQGLSMMLGLPTISSWNSSNRPVRPKRGILGFNEETNNLEYWDGQNWFKANMIKE